MAEGRGVLAIWHDIAPGHETAVLEWYNRQHHVERVSIPGFIRARRHSARVGGPALFIFYETQRPEILASEAYLRRVNTPTEWTRQCMPWFRNNSRTVCRISLSTQGPDGGHLATVRLAPRAGGEAVLRDYVQREVFPRLKANSHFLKAQLWERQEGITALRSTERIIRGAEDTTIPWAIVCSMSNPDALQALTESELSPVKLVEAGAEEGVQVGHYSLDFALEKDHIS